MESINDRILLIINHFELNKNSFSKRINISSSAVIENIVSGRRSKPSYDVLLKILFAFENIDANWLITGRGNMLKKTEQNETKVEEPIMIYKTCVNCKHKDELITVQKQNIEALRELCNSKDVIISNIMNKTK